MQNNRKLSEILQEICKSAIDGKLKLEDFYELWPKEANANPFFEQIYKDIEDGVEHIPGFFFRDEIDYETWHRLDLYFTLYIDYILLDFDRDTNELLQCRNFVLEQGRLTEEEIKQRISDYFKQ